MPQIQASAIASSYIHADELTESDIIQHNDSTLLIVSEPDYTNKGIEFEVMWNVVTPDNVQTACFAPDALEKR